MRIVALQFKNQAISISSNGIPTSFDDLRPMDVLASAIAKDIFEEIKRKAVLMKIDLNEFSVQVTLRKNTDKEKSKIIETNISLPNDLQEDTKNKFLKIANRSHLKRMLSNEMIFEPSRLLE